MSTLDRTAPRTACADLIEQYRDQFEGALVLHTGDLAHRSADARAAGSSEREKIQAPTYNRMARQLWGTPAPADHEPSPRVRYLTGYVAFDIDNTTALFHPSKGNGPRLAKAGHLDTLRSVVDTEIAKAHQRTGRKA